MNIKIDVDAVNAQFIYVKKQSESHFTIEIADVEIRDLPRWALEDLRNRIAIELERPEKSESI